MSSLRSLKYRARIPVRDGHLLYGIMDETNILKQGEVYIPVRHDDGTRLPLVRDRVIVTRAPALHPGDVQLVTAVNVPVDSPLQWLSNCIVFSQQGPRDLPSQLSGGDLDGDLFHIIFDERLMPDFTVLPADYTAPPAKDLGRPAHVNDIADFFINFMKADQLGQISTKHRIRADKLEDGTRDPECILLAKLASDAVDFSKSGNAVDMSQIPRGKDHIRPDFLAPGPNLIINNVGAAELEELDHDDIDEFDSLNVLNADRSHYRYYESKKVLGVLYRAIDEQKFFARMKQDFESHRRQWGDESLMQRLERYVDRETRGIQWQHHLEFAELLRTTYESNMLDIMDTLRPHRSKPLTELEVVSGNILGKEKQKESRYSREANRAVQERFDGDVSAFIKRIVSGDNEWEDDDSFEALPRAIACFVVSLRIEDRGYHSQLKSWKYITAAVCLEELWKYQGGKLKRL
jgi:hypothetical protein